MDQVKQRTMLDMDKGSKEKGECGRNIRNSAIYAAAY